MTDFTSLENLCREIGVYYTQDCPLREKTSFKIGGVAPIVIEPSSEEEIARLTAFMSERGIPYLTLGRGSNALFPDEGIDRAVLLLGERFSDIKLDGEKIVCQSGASLTKLCRFALENSLSGLEFAYGIPGSVGGAVSMNAGAYGGEIKDVLLSARHIGSDGAIGTYSGDELKLSYRHSAYSGTKLAVISAEVLLKKADPREISAKMEDFMGRRRSKQPLEYPSAGSTFKRPDGAYASELIDRCGLKGYSVGGAAVSEKHAGFIINTGGAKYSDVLELIKEVKRVVADKTGFTLEPEIKIYDRAGEEI